MKREKITFLNGKLEFQLKITVFGKMFVEKFEGKNV